MIILSIEMIRYVNGKAYKEPYLDQYKKVIDGNLTEDFKLEDVTGKRLCQKAICS